MTLVSVIIPTYNRAYILDRAIRSVLAQTHADFELLVVDDGSKDDTEALVRRYADPRVRYIKQPNQGQCAAINNGIAQAKGEFIECLDSDDEWLPAALEKQLAVFRAGSPDLGMVYMFTASLAPDGTVIPEFSSTLRGRIHKEVLTQGYLAPSITLMVRKSCYDEIGVWDTGFSCYQDDDMCFRLAAKYVIDFVPEILAYVHQDADAASRLMRNRAFLANGWWRLLTKHEADIRRECGDEQLAAHMLKAGRMFMEANDSSHAHEAFARAATLSRRNRLRLAVYRAVTRWRPSLWPRMTQLESRLGAR